MSEQTGFKERFVAFQCGEEACIGVVTMPAGRVSERHIAVVIVVGGPQYRVGSHRQFALLARSLAAAGFAAFRFDYRGIGDSEGEPRTFECIEDDLEQAIDLTCKETGAAKVVLWGLCDGASAALMYAAGYEKVAGIVALNPWARSPEVEASARLKHYYLRRLFSRELWSKVLAGRFDLADSTGGLLASVRDAGHARAAPRPFLQRMHDGWARFQRPVLFLLSGADLTAREFETWVAADRQRRALLAGAHSEIARFGAADHTFSTRAWRDAVAAKTIEWLARLIPRS